MLKSLKDYEEERLAHERVLERVNNMTSQELFEWSVKAGVYYSTGGLTPEYGGDPVISGSPKDHE